MTLVSIQVYKKIASVNLKVLFIDLNKDFSVLVREPQQSDDMLESVPVKVSIDDKVTL